MQPGELPEWQAEALRLLADWEEAARLARIDQPRGARWQSRDGAENHIIYVWSGNAYAPQLHFEPIFDAVGEAIRANRICWNSQEGFFRQAFAKFFLPASNYYPLNAVMVTPNRVPMRLWEKRGRQPMAEKREVPWHCEKPGSFTFRELSTPLALDLGKVKWADFEYARIRDFGLTSMWTPRAWGPWNIPVQRLFQADIHGPDIDALNAGAVPAMRDPRIIGTTPGRVELAMFQMLRLKHNGEADLVLFEVMNGSGLMVDIRGSQQGLDSILVPDPYFAPVFRQAMQQGKGLGQI